MDSKVIALFPLQQPLLPGEVRALRLFEPRYRELARDLAAMPEHERRFGITAVGHTDPQAGPHALQLYLTGTVAEVTSLEFHDDGTAYVETVGTDRFHIRSISQDRLYLQADISFIPERMGDGCRQQAEVMLSWYERYYTVAMPVLAAAGKLSPSQLRNSPAEMTTWPPKLLIASAMSTLAASAMEAQAVLETETYAEALAEVSELLRNETAAMQVIPSLPLRVESLVSQSTN